MKIFLKMAFVALCVAPALTAASTPASKEWVKQQIDTAINNLPVSQPPITATNWITVCGSTAAAENGCTVNTNNPGFSALDAQAHISFFLGLRQPLAASNNSVYLRMYDVNNINSSSTNTGPTISTANTGSGNTLKCSFYSPTGNNILPILVNNNSTPGQPFGGYPSPTFIAPGNLSVSGVYSDVFTESPNSTGFPSSFQGFLVCINTIASSGTPTTLSPGTLTSTDWT